MREAPLAHSSILYSQIPTVHSASLRPAIFPQYGLSLAAILPFSRSVTAGLAESHGFSGACFKYLPPKASIEHSPPTSFWTTAAHAL